MACTPIGSPCSRSRDKLQVDTRKPWTIDEFEAKYGSQVLAKARITGKF